MRVTAWPVPERQQRAAPPRTCCRGGAGGAAVLRSAAMADGLRRPDGHCQNREYSSLFGDPARGSETTPSVALFTTASRT